MKIFYILDCSKNKGIGHLNRSIIVAEQLKILKIKVIFLLINPDKLFKDALKNYDKISLKNYKQKKIAKEVSNLLINESFKYIMVDDYDLNKNFYKNLSNNIFKFSINDGNFSYKNINLIFDQSLTLTPKDNVISNKKFIIIKKSAFELKKKNFSNHAKQLKVGIFLGANIKINKIKNILQAIKKINYRKFYFHFFILGNYSNYINIINKKYIFKIKFFKNLSSNIFLKKLSRCDVAIGEGGNSALERYVMCLPSLNILTNKNQKKILNLNLNKKIFFTNKKNYKNSSKFYFYEINLFLSLFQKKLQKTRFQINSFDKFGAKRIALKIKSFINQNHLRTKHS